jgi:hypothetical protein
VAHYSPLGSGERGYNLHVARRRLNDAYTRDLFELWKKKGMQILEQVAREQPGVLVKCMTLMMPKEFKIESAHTVVAGLPDEQLHAMIHELQERIAKKLEDTGKVINGQATELEALPGPSSPQPWRPRRKAKAKQDTMDNDWGERPFLRFSSYYDYLLILV